MEVILGMCRGHAATTVHGNYGWRQGHVDLDELGIGNVKLVPPEATRWEFVRRGLAECVVG